MTLDGFLESLSPHDLSIALALRELIRRADGTGCLERGEWVAAVLAAHRDLPGAHPAIASANAAAAAGTRYFLLTFMGMPFLLP